MMRKARFLLAAVLLAALPASATTFVMVPDEALFEQAAAVVEVRVLSVEMAPVDGMPATDYLVEVGRVLKGDLPGSNLIVRVPGGFRPDGEGLKIWGAPEFAVGERTLLFLVPGEEGTYRVLHLMLGAFREATVDGRAVLVRDLSEVMELGMPGEPEGARARYRQPRDRQGFLRWIEERAQGVDAPAAGYFVDAAPGALAPVVDNFSFFTSSIGRKMRWFEFDNGQGVPWRVLSGGQEGLTPQETISAVQAGLAAWVNDAATNVDYNYAGTTGSVLGLDDPDGINAIIFGDPNNDSHLDSPYNCTQGGVLAVGGPFINSGMLDVHNGEQFHPIGEADIVTNANVGCFFTASPNKVKAAEELFGHELGHTLGLGHSCDGSPCDNQALMHAFIHDDGRGAQLTADDRTALAYLYGFGQPPAAPSALQATLLSTSSVRLAWQDNSSDETGFRIERRVDGIGNFQQVLQVGADVETADLTGLAAQTSYSFRVRATNAIGNSAYSNVVTVFTSAALPAAPAKLVARPLSTSSVELTWNDNSSNEIGFVIERASPLADFQLIQITAPGVTQVVMPNLAPDRPYTFRVKARGATGDSAYSNEASATPFDLDGSGCVGDDATLCLLGDRFKVRVSWRNQYLAGDHGIGHAEPFSGSSQTGRFWFFDSANVELVVKALDGRPVNGKYWLFYGALSDVEYWITVRDTDSGLSKTYHNPPYELCGRPDNAAFPGDSPAVGAPLAAPPASRATFGPPASTASIAGSAGTGCMSGPETLCLFGDRFEVRVDWLDPRSGDFGTGKSVPGTDNSGYFWFFNSENIELVTKVLDNRPLGGNFWFFYGALSDVSYTITVRDTETQLTKFYTNQPYEFCGEGDTGGFPATLP